MLSDATLSDATMAYGEEMTAALLGVDALYRAESDDDEGLVVLNMAAATHTATPFANYAAAIETFTDLSAAAGDLPEADRRRYYEQLCHSTLAFMEWRTDGLAFEQQLADFLHVPAAPAEADELAELRQGLGELLDRMGYRGSLSEQCVAWEADNRVPAAEIPEVLDALLDEAWDRTAAIMEIPAPKSDGMRVIPVSGQAFNARCNYLARKVELNTDPILTRPGLKHLAVHEGYPGHYVQFKLREAGYAARQGPGRRAALRGQYGQFIAF